MPNNQLAQSGSGWNVVARQQSADGLTVTTYARKARRYDIVSSANAFSDIAFYRFDLAQVCGILMHANPSFEGHKDALAAALCSWILGNHHWALRRRSVGLSIATTLARAQKVAIKKWTYGRAGGDRHLLPTRLPPAFFDELYYPIGGFPYIARIPARYGLREELKSQRDRLHHTITIAAIDHCHHLVHEAKLTLEDVSVERSCEVAALIQLTTSGTMPPNVNNLKTQYLIEFRESLPFLYAASTIKYSEQESLLDAIAGTKWASILQDNILRQLFGRALFYAKDIYGNNKKAKGREIYVERIIHALRGVEPISFDPPTRVSCHAKIIEHYYSEAGYEACHADDAVPFWQQAPFWSALNLPVPKLKRSARNDKPKPVKVQRIQ